MNRRNLLKVMGSGIVGLFHGSVKADTSVSTLSSDSCGVCAASYSITPNEIRALRGRKPYLYGNDDPMTGGEVVPIG